jgi:hypothetical protein
MTHASSGLRAKSWASAGVMTDACRLPVLLMACATMPTGSGLFWQSLFPTKVICLAIYSRCVNAEIGIEQVLGRSFSWVFGMGGRVQAAARDICRNIIDYDDLLLHWAQTVNDPTLVEDIDGRFDHVLVDQCQNTNRMTSMRRSVVQQI